MHWQASALRELGLFSYQVEWLTDPSDFRIGLWSRQTGKDFTCAAEAVLDCYVNPGTHWLIVAASERQARESLEKARAWLRRIRLLSGEKLGGCSPVQLGARELRLANGSRITALPGKPETVRGFSANVILTEFAFHSDPEALWRAVFPMVTNQMRGGRKRLRIITTPNGQGTFFHRLWKDWSFGKQLVTIHDAKAAGLPIDLEQLRLGISSPEAWAQEYECQFTDTNSVLLPYVLIESCESAEASETATPELLSRTRNELFAGIDFGRKHDLTVCWMLEKNGETFVTREILVLERMSTPEQMAALRSRVRLTRKTCIDSTGAGIGLGDMLAQEFHSKVELCQLTAKLKEELFPRLRAAFERGQVQIPASKVVRDDLHGIQRMVSSHGQLSYRATHTADGHSDRATALALALRAADSVPRLAIPTSSGEGFRSRR